MANRSIFCTAVRVLFFLATISPLSALAAQAQRTDRRENRSMAAIPAAQATVITGVVVQENGTPLPSGIVIENICHGTVRRESTVDSFGRFTFQAGHSAMHEVLVPDARDGPPLVEVQSESLAGCEIRAHAPGYRSTVVTLSVNATGRVEAGTLVLYSLSRVQGTSVSARGLAAPKGARKNLDRSRSAMRENKNEEAERLLRSALQIYSAYPAAWLGLAQLYEKTRRMEEARAALLKAIEVDANYAEPYIQLARVAAEQHRWQDVASLTDRALKLDPIDYVDGYFLNALGHYNLDKLEVAERSARKVLQMDPLHRLPQVHLLLAKILERRQNTAGAMEQLRIYRALSANRQ